MLTVVRDPCVAQEPNREEATLVLVQALVPQVHVLNVNWPNVQLAEMRLASDIPASI